MLKNLVFALLAALLLSGCAAIKVVQSSKVTVSQVVIVGNAADAIEATATNYLQLRKCAAGEKTGKAVCRDPRATKPIIAAIHSERTARDAFTAFYKAHPDGIGAAGLYDGLNSSIAIVSATLANFGAI